jgi:hypothetical protein
MSASRFAGAALTAMLVAGCGGSDEPQEKQDETMKVEDTAFGPLVTAPKKVQDRTNAAVELNRESMNRRLEEDEGGSPPAEDPAGD